MNGDQKIDSRTTIWRSLWAAVLSQGLAAPSQAYVANYEDFKQHIERHRHRVEILGLDLARAYFSHINQKQLQQFLRLHDTSKVLPAHVTETSQPLSLQLYEYYGKSQRLDFDHRGLKNLVTHMNNIDDEVAENFLQKNKVTQAHDFRLIERIADLVDRGLDPVASEEFGRPTQLASRYVQTPREKKLALYLEEQRYQVLFASHGAASLNKWHVGKKNT